MRFTPTISIVTRVSRPARYLQRVLDGLLLQSGAALIWSLVHQSDLTDDHQAVINRAQNAGLNIVMTKANKDIPVGRLANLGVTATPNADFVILHDDDDQLIADFTGPGLKMLINSSLCAIACPVAYIREETNRLDFILNPGRGKISQCDLQRDNMAQTNGLIFRRSVYDKIGGYREDVNVAEDWLFNLSLLEHGDIGVYPKVSAKVFVRSGVGEHTNHNAHVDMQNAIRKKYGISDPDRRNKQQAKFASRMSRNLDRLYYMGFKKFRAK